MELSGPWRAQLADENLRRIFPLEDLDDSHWPVVDVPGHWRDHVNFVDVEGPVLYRSRFEANSPSPDRRVWLEFDGLFYQGDVWLDGTYVGDTEGYFFSHLLEVTDRLRQRSEHLLAVEVTCPPRPASGEGRTLTGTTQDGWNPGGIWRSVRLRETGPVAIRHLRVVCTDASPTVATLAVRAVVDTARPRPVVFRTTVSGIDHRHPHPLAAGKNSLEWMVRVPRPRLWWPHELGDQPLSDLQLTVATDDGAVSDSAMRKIGFRSVRMRDHVWRVNGERLYLRGAIVPPLLQSLASVDEVSATADLHLARELGLNLLRVAGHVSHPILYEVADRMGMLIWQDMPLSGTYHRGIRGQAVAQAQELVDRFGHHPSIIVWCGHDAPDPVDRTRAAPRLIDQQKPTWTRTVLARSVRRSLDRADPSRPVVSHSGVLPNLPRMDDADSHLWFGWHAGRAADMADYLDRVPRAGRFVSAFGTQSVPTGCEVLDPTRWPTVDWADMANRFGAHAEVLARRFPPEDHPDAETWAEATRSYQTQVLRTQIELLRRLKYRPSGGFALDRLLDGAPAISGSIFDHQRNPKPAWTAISNACAPTIVVAWPPPFRLESPGELQTWVSVIHDGREPLDPTQVTAELTVAGTKELWAWQGRVEADSVVDIGGIIWPIVNTTGLVDLVLRLEAGEITVENRYRCEIG
ncbi:MAG: sugar-binding domain-containing protein [Actinomycetota bacterium]|nr:sugar-binding domain-containing protein [Actinomycetota bacterium]